MCWDVDVFIWDSKNETSPRALHREYGRMMSDGKDVNPHTIGNPYFGEMINKWHNTWCLAWCSNKLTFNDDLNVCMQFPVNLSHHVWKHVCHCHLTYSTDQWAESPLIFGYTKTLTFHPLSLDQSITLTLNTHMINCNGAF